MLTCIQFIFAPLSVGSPQTSPEMVLLEEFVHERDLESVQEEHFLLLCVHKCSAPSGQEGLVFHKCFKISVNVNIQHFSCLHGCDHIVRLG